MGAFKLNYRDYFYCTKKCNKANHLGNVLTLFTDKKIPVGTGNTVSYYKADLVSSMDYSPFGAPLKGRTFNGSGSRYGFNGQEKDNEISGVGNHLDFAFRGYDPRLGRFTAVDPLSAKFPMLSVYQFGSLNPVTNIDLDGLEGVPSISHEIFKSAGITTVTAQQIEYNVKVGIVKAARLSQDALIVTGGVLTVVASGGATLPIALGVVAAGGGSTKFYFDAKGNYDESDATPTSISGVVMVTANYMVGEEVFSQNFQSTVSFVEGVATLDLKNLKSPNLLTKTTEAIGLMNLSIDATSIPDNLKEILSPNTNYIKSPTQNAAPADNTRVATPAMRPEMKNKEKESKKPTAKAEE